MKIGLYFGSFNPIHNGHLAIAQSMIDQGEVDKVRFIISPQSPFKKKPSLAHAFDRLDMVSRAIEDNFKMEVSNVEFDMPTPSYTIDTLLVLSEKEPEKMFVLIIGEDNVKSFHRWKKADVILKHYEVLIYQRSGSTRPEILHSSFRVVDGPMFELSASYLREQIKKGHSVEYLMPKVVSDFIESKRLYKIKSS